MGELLSSLWTPEIQVAVTICVVFLVILYILSIVWVARDAYLRGTTWVVWAIVALIPLLGVIAYCLMRPHMYRIDQDEQELEIALKQRQLQQYGECGNCGYPVEADYVICPSCHTRLKNMCPNCRHALEPHWTICPYCATSLTRPQNARRRQQPRRSPQQGQQRRPQTQGNPQNQ